MLSNFIKKIYAIYLNVSSNGNYNAINVFLGYLYNINLWYNCRVDK